MEAEELYEGEPIEVPSKSEPPPPPGEPVEPEPSERPNIHE